MKHFIHQLPFLPPSLLREQLRCLVQSHTDRLIDVSLGCESRHCVPEIRQRLRMDFYLPSNIAMGDPTSSYH